MARFSGYSWALAAGDILARLTTAETPDIDLVPFDPDRFDDEGFGCPPSPPGRERRDP